MLPRCPSQRYQIQSVAVPIRLSPPHAIDHIIYYMHFSSLKFIPLAPSKARSPRQLSTKREPKQQNTFKKKRTFKGVLLLFDHPAPSLQKKTAGSCSVSRRHSINEALHSWSCSSSRFQTVNLIVLPDDERWVRSLKNNPLNEKWPMKPESGVKDCF